MTLDTDQITEILKKNSLRVTKSRIAVARIFTDYNQDFLTSEEIYLKIKQDKTLSCDQASVYRTLSTYEELGIVQKSDFNKDASRYKLNESFGKKDHHHKHYFKCVECSTVEPFSDCFIHKKEKELEASGYKNLHHHIEITGLCPSCAL